MNDTRHQVSQFVHEESDAIINSWTFVDSPWQIIILLVVYLSFILKIGPKLMAKREPVNIKSIVLAYNLLQIVFNGYILAYLFFTPEVPSYLRNHWCHPDFSKNHIAIELHKSTWYFSVTKIFDLLDTIFFVLRKKQSHVTFLHVYHHVNMVITCFFHLRFIKSENAVICTILNSFVHIIMYSYYFLSALGPNVRKHLWWKKYLTSIQIIQFLLGIIYCFSLLSFDCYYPKLFFLYVLVDVSLFLYMFLKFYKKTYKPEEKLQ